MRDLLKKVERERLFDFLEEYAKRNPQFDNAIRVEFSEPVFHDELDKISLMIDDVLKDATDEYHGNRNSWGCISVDTSGVISEIERRAAQGHIKLAFAELEILYRKLLKAFEYQGECEISDEADFCLHLMSNVADKAVNNVDKEYIYEHCIDLAFVDDGKDYGADYIDQLLKISYRLITNENSEKLEDAMLLLQKGRTSEVEFD